MLSVKQGSCEYQFVLTRLGIKRKSTAPEAEALTTRPSELLNLHLGYVELEASAYLELEVLPPEIQQLCFQNTLANWKVWSNKCFPAKSHRIYCFFQILHTWMRTVSKPKILLPCQFGSVVNQRSYCLINLVVWCFEHFFRAGWMDFGLCWAIPNRDVLNRYFWVTVPNDYFRKKKVFTPSDVQFSPKHRVK